MRELAEATGLHRSTITNIEIGRYAGDQKSLEIIQADLKKAGVEFIDETVAGQGWACANQKRPKLHGIGSFL